MVCVCAYTVQPTSSWAPPQPVAVMIHLEHAHICVCVRVSQKVELTALWGRTVNEEPVKTVRAGARTGVGPTPEEVLEVSPGWRVGEGALGEESGPGVCRVWRQEGRWPVGWPREWEGGPSITGGVGVEGSTQMAFFLSPRPAQSWGPTAPSLAPWLPAEAEREVLAFKVQHH